MANKFEDKSSRPIRKKVSLFDSPERRPNQFDFSILDSKDNNGALDMMDSTIENGDKKKKIKKKAQSVEKKRKEEVKKLPLLSDKLSGSIKTPIMVQTNPQLLIQPPKGPNRSCSVRRSGEKM
jgi:hypothetical protein